MSQYPISTPEGLYEAVNYLASGPSGLGQNFAGFSSYDPVYIRPTFNQPFTIAVTATTSPPSWYVPAIAVTGAQIIGNATGTNTSTNYEISFTPQPTVPFSVGASADPEGIIDDLHGANSNYNGSADVLACTTSSVIFQTTKAYDLGTYVSGGTITKLDTDNFVSTDCNARVFVTGPTDRVFISSQLSLEFTYSCTMASEIDIVIAVNRYIPTTTATPAVGTDYRFSFDKTISQVSTRYNTTTSGTINMLPTIFTSVIDQPSYGYFWYILELSFNKTGFTDIPGGIYFNSGKGVTFSGTQAAQIDGPNTYSGLTPINVSSTGSGAVMDIKLYSVNDSPYTNDNGNISGNTQIKTISNIGSNYRAGDVLKILGTDLGGTSPANDLYLTLDGVATTGDVEPGIFTAGLRSLTAQVVKQ